jgi:transcriptional regulator with XRE-family HTH domain
METVNERILMLIKGSKLSKNKFGNKAGLSSSLISQISNIKTPTGLSVETISKIIKTYDVNPTWLLFGTGSIYTSELENTIFSISPITTAKHIIQTIAALERTMAVTRSRALRDFEIDGDTINAVIDNYAMKDVSEKDLTINVLIDDKTAYALTIPAAPIFKFPRNNG